MRKILELQKLPAFYVRDIPVYGDLILAPMSGYSDSPDRIIARRFGSSMSYTEFVNAIDILQNFPLIENRLTFQEIERPVVFQIFDNDPERMMKAADLLFPFNPDILDINLGCSARKVLNRGAGAGLLRKPELIRHIVSELIKISPIPVTAKIRLGWDEASKNYIEIARMLEGEGVALIAVHGRTGKQAYTGMSDWEAIAEIKKAVKIPIIANGDVKSVQDIDRIKTVTGCDGIMIGRGSIGNPWIFSRVEHRIVLLAETRSVALEHLSLMADFYGEEWGQIRFRKHLKAYLMHYNLSRKYITSLMTAPSIGKLIFLITNIEEAILQ